MINECIILAGGLGTRLRSVISDLPKCMAPVAGKPFLSYVTAYLQKQGVEKFIFSVGYKSEVIEEYLQNRSLRINYTLSIEDEPLGTGGAVKLACLQTAGKNALVVNGDTLFRVSVNRLSLLHETTKAHCTVSLKPMQNFDRYGAVELSQDHSVRSFKEKQFFETGLINGGVYALSVNKFLEEGLPDKFSFEKDYLEKIVSASNHEKGKKIFGVVQDKYFVDIGIPADYERAQIELNDQC